MNGKRSDGSWAPISGGEGGDTNANRSIAGWTEGDAWVYTWGAFHDQAGLMDLMGGAENYAKYLDQHFAGGHNDHNNEPSHHYGYLYDFAGQPWKTQERVRQIAAAHYKTGPAGLIGDDDCGQMSAWFIFTAMGFYPVNAASGEYMIGSPLYRQMSLKLANGKTFTVQAENNSAENQYIQSATIDGKPLTDPVLTWEQIQAGATVKFVMGPKPSQWGSAYRPKGVVAM
jgi:predicted alpha-1,2-mannosidase